MSELMSGCECAEPHVASPVLDGDRLAEALRSLIPLAVRSMGGYSPFGPRLPEPNGEIFQADKRAIERALAALDALESKP